MMVALRWGGVFLLSILICYPFGSTSIVWVKASKKVQQDSLVASLSDWGRVDQVCQSNAWKSCQRFTGTGRHHFMILSPQKLVAIWKGYWLSSRGDLIDRLSSPLVSEGLVEIDAENIDVDYLVSLIKVFPKGVLKAVSMNKWGSMELMLSPNIKAKLGRKLQLPRARMVAKLIEKLPEDAASKGLVLDMRYPKGYTLKKV